MASGKATKAKAENRFFLGRILGTGSHATVREGRHQVTDAPCAVKVMDLTRTDAQQIRREVCIQKRLSHPSIIRFLGCHMQHKSAWVAMQLADGGELSDRIDPGVEEHPLLAHLHFRQLLAAVIYIHGQGVAHRDLKPENLLLDRFGNLSVSDFGTASLFRHRGVERRLGRCCGTFPYMAPEILGEDLYRGDVADAWSCAVVLVVLLSGCFPWELPSYACAGYQRWLCGLHDAAPWPQLHGTGAFDMLHGLLTPDPEARKTLSFASAHPWTDRETLLTMELNGHGRLEVDANVLIDRSHLCHDSQKGDSKVRARKRPRNDAQDGGECNHRSGTMAMAAPQHSG